MQDTASFWTDIKNLEEQLAKEPESHCFARLAEVYLKVGLIDDALHIARQGVMKRPGYISGQRALSQACYAKGLNDEALTALKVVAEALPEDTVSQKLFGRLLSESGENERAIKAFRIALEFTPDDVEARIELESLERPFTDMAADNSDDEEILDDLEILDELEIVDDEESEESEESESEYSDSTSDFEFEDATPAVIQDPLSTATLAELYVKQGFIDKALDIYRAILSDNPSNSEIAEKVKELEELEYKDSPSVEEFQFSEEVPEDATTTVVDTVDEKPLFNTVPEIVFTDSEPEVALESEPEPFDIVLVSNTFAEVVEKTPTVQLPQQGIADNALATLDRWLENIRRIKSCR